MTKATRLVNARAANLRAHEETRYRITILAVVLLALASVLAAWYLGRSITRPLRRLVTHAGTVSDGHLGVEALPARGPKETRLVSSAFNDLVSNLRLLESKSHALASCDFADPVLAQPLPGRLGQSIQDSVRVLWGSIEERNSLQDRLAEQATHDSLTGMHNRAAAVSAIDHALARARRTSEAVALLYVDLDDFKVANDTHGHEVGDGVLREVGSRMGAAVRAGDFVARLGGDEFLVLVEQVVDITEAATLAQRVIDAITQPIETDGLRLNVGASVGIALALDGNDNALQLLTRADLALYRAKQRGRSKVELYDESLQRQLLERADVERGLSDTLARGGDELQLHYQPVTVTSTGTLTAVEALVRWDRPGYGLVPPDGFVPAAEASSLIIDLDLWVLQTAARQLVAWADEPAFAELSIAVNISGRHLLSQQLDEHVLDVLARTGADPTRLVLEITETVLLHDLPTAAQQLDAVRALGIRIAIDDFGTGYTSLAHLQRLPIDTIKIDRSFVSEIAEHRNLSLVRMVTDLGHQLGLGIVAEGVETAEQLHALAELGCDTVQGYLISRPVPVAQFVAWHTARVAGTTAEGS